MLSVNGLIAILDEPQERQNQNGSRSFTFIAVTKDRTGKLHKYKASLYVGDKDYEEAKPQLKRSKVILVKYGEWSAADSKTYPGSSSNFLNLMWHNIQVLGWFSNRVEQLPGEKNA